MILQRNPYPTRRFTAFAWQAQAAVGYRTYSFAYGRTKRAARRKMEARLARPW